MCEPDAEQAIKEMNGFQFNGTRLVVRRQEPRKKYVFARSFKKKKIHLKFQYLAVLFYLKMFPWKIIQSHICSVVEGQSRESLTVTGASRVPMLMVLVV